MAVDIKNDVSLGANIVAAYPFTDASGNQTDESGNGHTMTDNNTVITIAGIDGDSASVMNGVNEYFEAVDPFHISDNFSVSLWVKYNSFTGDNRLVDKWYTASEYIVRANGTTPGVLISCSGGNVSVNGATASTATWYHYGVSYNSTDGLKFYINAGTPVTAAANGTINNTSERLGIGAATNSTNTAQSSFHDGNIWQVLFYDKTLTAANFTDIYNGGAGLPWDGGGGGLTANNSARRHFMMGM